MTTFLRKYQIITVTTLLAVTFFIGFSSYISAPNTLGFFDSTADDWLTEEEAKKTFPQTNTNTGNRRQTQQQTQQTVAQQILNGSLSMFGWGSAGTGINEGPSGFVPLAPIPGLTAGEAGRVPSVNTLINAAYQLLIAVAAMIAVVKITIAGITHMASDAVGTKSKAKDEIGKALFGLAIILLTVIILQTLWGNVGFNLNLTPVKPSVPINDPVGTKYCSTIQRPLFSDIEVCAETATECATKTAKAKPFLERLDQYCEPIFHSCIIKFNISECKRIVPK